MRHGVARRAARAALARARRRARTSPARRCFMSCMPGRGRLRLPDHDDLRGGAGAAHAARAGRRVGAALTTARLRPALVPARREGRRAVRHGDDREAGRLGRARQHDGRDAAERRRAGAEYELTGHKWFCSAPMCDLFLVLAQTDERHLLLRVPRCTPDGDAQRVPPPAPQGQARQPLQRLERGRVPRRLGADGRRARAAACRRSSRWSATRAWTACIGARRRDARRRSRRRPGTPPTAPPSASCSPTSR